MIEEKSLHNHEFFMERCLELATNGMGYVAPNPMVGSVIVCNDRIIGEGFHQKYGMSHAEVNAIHSVKDHSLLKDSTLYVNLEPCAHMGKTPPCSDLIIGKKIPRVVIGISDPNSLVAGKGIEKLRKSGVEVTDQILPVQCRELNKRFFTYHQKKKPYIILKWAQTSDGFMDVIRKSGDAVGVNWISNSTSRKLVHKWRSEEQAIMTGTNTIIYDDPALTVRLWKGNSPLRIIIDRNLRIPRSAKVLNHEVPTIIFNDSITKTEENTEYIRLKNKTDAIKQILDEMYRREILSVIVEGGKRLLESFLENEVWDEARVLIGKKKFSSGLKAPEIQTLPVNIEQILDDNLHIYTNNSNYEFIQ